MVSRLSESTNSNLFSLPIPLGYGVKIKQYQLLRDLHKLSDKRYNVYCQLNVLWMANYFLHKNNAKISSKSVYDTELLIQ